MPNIIAEMTARIAVDKKDAVKQVDEALKSAQKTVDGNSIVYKITGDKKELENVINQIKKDELDINISPVLQYDQSKYTQQINKLKKFVDKEARSLATGFKKNFESEFKTGKDSSLTKYVHNYVSPEADSKTIVNLEALVKTLSQKVQPIDWSNVTDPDQVREQAKVLTELVDIRDKIYNSKQRKLNNLELGDKLDLDKYVPQLSELYKQMGEHFANNSASLIENLTSQAETELKEFRETITQALGGGIGSSDKLGAESSVESFNASLKAAEEQLESLQKEANSIDMSKLQKELKEAEQSYLDAADEENEKIYAQKAKRYAEAIRQVRKYGGTLSQDNIDDYDFLYDDNYIDEKFSDITVRGLKEINQEAEAVQKNINGLKAKIDNLNGSSATKPFENAEQELSKLKAQLDSYSGIEDELSDAYAEADRLSDELEESKSNAVDLYSTISKLTEELEALKAETGLRSGTLDGEQLDAVKAAEKIQELESQLESAFDRYKKQGETVTQLFAQIEQLQAKVTEKTAASSSSEQQLADAKQKLAEQEKLLEQQTAESDELRANLDSISGILSECVSKLKQFNFDPLAQAIKQLDQFNLTKDSKHYDKAASYYGLYKENGGTEKAISSSGVDVTDQLIQRYKELVKAQNLSREEAVKALNAKNTEILVTRQRIEELEKENKALSEKIKLEKESIEAEKAASTVSKENQKKNQTFDDLAKKRGIDKAGIKNSNSAKSTASSNQTVEVEVVPKIDPEKFKQSIESQLSGTSIDISINPQLAQTTEPSGGQESELSSISNLDSAVSTLTQKIESKTQAFREEAAVVAKVIPEETQFIGKLVSALVKVDAELTLIKNSIAQLPSVDFKIDLSGLNPDVIDDAALSSFNALRNQLTGLDAQLSTSRLESNLREIYGIFDSLSKVKGIPNLNLKGLNLNTLEKVAKKYEDILDLAESIMLLSEGIKELNSLTIDKDTLQGLKVSKANINNMESLAIAIDKVKESLNNFDEHASSVLVNIRELTEQASALKDLSSIIKQGNKIKSAQKAVEEAASGGSDKKAKAKEVDEISDAYNRLIANEERYQKLTTKQAYGNLSADETATLERLRISREKDLTVVQKATSLSKEQIKVQNEYKQKQKEVNQVVTVYANKLKEIQAQKNGKMFEVGFASDKNEAKQVMLGYLDTLENLNSESVEWRNNGQSLIASYRSNTGEVKKLTLSYDSLAHSVTGVETSSKKAVSGISKFISGLKGKWQEVAKYVLSFGSWYEVINIFKQLASYVVELDTNMTELTKVADESGLRLEQSFKNSVKSAKELGASISDTISATADWKRLGYSLDQSEELARVALLYKNVGDGIDIDTANESLVSTLQGFQLEAENAIEIVDKFNEVANNFPTSSAGIGDALQRSAASFYAANTDLSKSIALIVGANSVLQDEDKVGNMWRTVSARIRGASTELSELGEETDEYVETTSKLRDLVKGITGFDIMEDEETYKDIYEIIIGIGKEWKNLTDIEQAGLLEALAGKQQSNALAASLNNVDMIKEAYKTAENSAGSAKREQEKYQESIQYSLDRFTASVQELSNILINSGIMKFFVDLGTTGVSALTNIIDLLGGLELAIAGIATAVAQKSGLD